MKGVKQLGVYVISNIHPSRHDYIDSVCSKLDDSYSVFRPHADNQYNLDNVKIQFAAFHKDQQEMDRADISLVLMPLFGRDCAAEIGYSKGIGNVVIAFVAGMETYQERDWLNDWMVKGFIDNIITTDKSAFDLLSNNLLIAEKEQFEKKKVVYFLESEKKLSDLITDLLKENKYCKK